MKQKRRNDRSPATKFCVALTDTAADSRSTAPVTSAAVTPASSPPQGNPSRNRRAWLTYPRTVPAARAALGQQVALERRQHHLRRRARPRRLLDRYHPQPPQHIQQTQQARTRPLSAVTPAGPLEGQELIDPLAGQLSDRQPARLQPAAQSRHLTQLVDRRQRRIAPPPQLQLVRRHANGASGPVIKTLLTLLAGPAILVSFSRQPKEEDDHSDIVMPTPRRQSPRPTTTFHRRSAQRRGRHNRGYADVGISTTCGTPTHHWHAAGRRRSAAPAEDHGPRLDHRHRAHLRRPVRRRTRSCRLGARCPRRHAGRPSVSKRPIC